MSNFRPPRELAPIGGSPPISSDPPFHHDARKLLLPAFTKTAVARQEPATRAFCHSLIDAFEGRDVVDAAGEYAQHIPMRVIADMLGFPPEDGPQFREFVENLLEGINLPPEERIERMSRLFDYLLAQVHDHLDHPREDLTTYLHQRRALRPEARTRTTWSARWPCCSSPASTRPGARSAPRCGTWRRPRPTAGGSLAEPALLPTAIEEFLRAYAPVTMARLVKEDMHWHGVDMEADDWILLSFPAANRDPAAVRPRR